MAHLAGLGGLLKGSSILKKKPVKLAFTELDLTSDAENWKKTPTARMREIDTYRLHVPAVDERKNMKIPESDYERMRMTDHMHMMILCGGYAGIHFSSEEIATIMEETRALDTAFIDLENFFNSLSSSTRRHALNADNSIPRPPPVVHAQEAVSAVAAESAELLPPPPPTAEEQAAIEAEDATNSETIEFHIKADRVLAALHSLQNMVKIKQALVNSDDSEGVMSGDADGEGEGGFSSRARPSWIEILIKKYTSHTDPAESTASSPSTSNQPTPTSSSSSFAAILPAPPVGKFAAFLSCCVTLQIDCIRSEEAAIIELILASSNQHGNIVSPEKLAEEIFSHTQKYWAHRFFEFIKKLPEFKTAMRDEKSLYNFSQFL